MDNDIYQKIIIDRVKRLEKIRSGNVDLDAINYHYKFNPISFVNDWAWTHDPRRKNLKTLPMVLWTKQEDYFDWLDDRVELEEDGVVDKCRDAGATWLNCWYSIHRWIYFDGFNIGFGSRKEKLVDTIGDPDSIFEKMRIGLRLLPNEFLPRTFNIDKHATHLKIKNPVNGAVIAGEGGDNIGRGGRSTMYFKDESAFYERPLKIDAALSHNSDVKIDVSTHNGIGNLFYQKRFSGKYPVFEFDWTDDKRKDQEWYDKRKEKEDPIIFAQEVDRDPGASAEGICIPARWVKAAVNFEIPGEGEKVAGLDVADDGGDLNAICFREGSVVPKPIKSWKKGTPAESARKAYHLCLENGMLVLKFDTVGIGVSVRDELDHKEYKDLKAEGFSSASKPTAGWYIKPDPENQIPGKKNRDQFLNLRAEAWWKVRRRFEKTFETREGIREHDPDDMISIPDDRETIAELSMPKYKYTDNGKIKIESKQDMKARGVKSPNNADSLIYAFAPVEDKGPHFRVRQV